MNLFLSDGHTQEVTFVSGNEFPNSGKHLQSPRHQQDEETLYEVQTCPCST